MKMKDRKKIIIITYMNKSFIKIIRNLSSKLRNINLNMKTKLKIQ